MKTTTRARTCLLLALVAILAACGGKPEAGTATEDGRKSTKRAASKEVSLEATLDGAGATFPQSYYEDVFTNFQQVAPNVIVNYGGGGSGEGQTKLADGVVDFAGTDTLVKKEDLAKYKGGEFLYVPTVAAPITVSYNLPGVKKLLLSPDLVAAIFSRQVTRWDDARIAAENKSAKLPARDIVVVRRSDGSGTTANFTKYLTKAAPGTWKLGTGKEVPWPDDTQGGNGNGGVAQAVKSAEGAVGYVDFSDARASGLQVAYVKNAAGRYVPPTLAGATNALAGAKLEADLTYDPLDAKGPAAYPITAPTFIIVYRHQSDATKAKALKLMLKYLLTEGQKSAADVNFARLPSTIAEKSLAQVDEIEAK